MDISRRHFIGATAGAAVAIGQGPLRAADDDPLGVRADFPILRELTFLNTAYAGLIPGAVVKAAREWTDARARGGYTVQEMFAKTDEARKLFAALVGAHEDEIGFVSSTSDGENLVVNSLEFEAGDNVVFDDLVYPSTPIIYQRLADAHGVDIRVVKSRGGAAALDDFAKLVDRRTRLVSVAWVSNNSGYRHDVKALARLAHAHGAFLYADAVQFVGTGPVDVRSEEVDFFATGAYKWLLAGFGVAAFYVRRELMDRIHPGNVGWHSARRVDEGRYEHEKTARKFEYATPAFGELYQLAASLRYLQRVGLERIEAQSQSLVRRFRSGLAERKIPIATPDGNRSSIVSFYIRKPAADAGKILEAARVRVSLQGLERSDPAAAAGFVARVRVALAFFNNAADVDRMLLAAEKLSSN
jgi:selenocysteine lyase/cysteine desulfurase